MTITWESHANHVLVTSIMQPSRWNRANHVAVTWEACDNDAMVTWKHVAVTCQSRDGRVGLLWHLRVQFLLNSRELCGSRGRRAAAAAAPSSCSCSRPRPRLPRGTCSRAGAACRHTGA